MNGRRSSFYFLVACLSFQVVASRGVAAEAPAEPVTPLAPSSASEAPATPLPAEGGQPGPSVSPPADAEGDFSVNDESRVVSQVASFAVTRLKDSPAIVTVITGDDLRAVGVRDLVDILGFVPGFFVGVDTEGVVGAGIRGLWGYEGKILLLIDGKEMNELLFSTTQLGNEFPIELIERVEVVRGPGSVIYGGNAELAVINIVTRSLQGATDALVAGSYGQMTGASHLSSGYDGRRLVASGRYIFEGVPGLSTFASFAGGQGQRSVRSFVDNSGVATTMEGQSALDPTVAQAGVGYKDLQATFLYHRMAMTTVDGLGQALPAPFAMSFESYQADLIGTFRPTNDIEIVPRLNYVYQQPWKVTDNQDLFYYKSVERLRARLLGRWAALDELQLTAGLDGIFDHARLEGPEGLINTPFGTSGVSYQTFGAYAEAYSENPFVNVSVGARYDHLSTIGGALVPRVSLQRRFGLLSLKAIYSQSFRAPGIENINTNPSIRSERTNIFEFEGAVDVSPWQRISANIYAISISEPIAYFTDPTTMADKYVNLGRQGSDGLEVSYRLHSHFVVLDANYAYYRVMTADNTPTYVVPGHSEVFLGAPAHRGSFRATFRPWPWLGISPSAVVMGERFMRGPDTAAGLETATSVPAEILANLYVFTDRLGIPGLSVGLGVYNLFGADFNYIHVAASPGTFMEDHPSMPGLDREVMLKLAYYFDPYGSGGRGSAP